MYSIYKNLKSTVTSSLQLVLLEKTQEYSLKYTTGVEEHTDYYSFTYTSNYLSDFSNSYTVAYTSLYGDSVNTYRIRYYSGVELTDRLLRYSLKYTSNFINAYTSNYTLRYSTLSPTESSYRKIYKLRYSSVGSKENAVQYTVRYSLEFFKNRSSTYHIRYNSHTPFAYDTSAVLLRSNSSTAVLFCLRGSVDILDKSIFVFSNLPRYQLVSMNPYENRTNIEWLDVETIKPYNLFSEYNDDDNTAPPVAYILVKDIYEINNLSLDIYDEESLEKLNKSKSFFFDLDNNAFILNPTTLGDEYYTYTNFTSEYYNYAYLNFVERSLTPLFRISDNCCFNTKINSTTTGGMCSPF